MNLYKLNREIISQNNLDLLGFRVMNPSENLTPVGKPRKTASKTPLPTFLTKDREASVLKTILKSRLILFCGLPSSGKSTIARLVASELGNAVHIQTDIIRYMFPKPSYTRDESSFVYSAMFQVGKEALRRGFDAILDATFLKEDYRAEAVRKLSRFYSKIYIIGVTCALDTVVARNNRRKGAEVVPTETLLRFHSMYENPKNAIVVDSDKLAPESSARFILE